MFVCQSVELPMDIVLSKIIPLLDRNAFDRLSATSKEFHDCLKHVLPPWPDRLVAKDHLCQITTCALSCKGTIVAGGCSDGMVRLWHVQSGEQQSLEGHWPDESITNVAFGRRSSDILASASTDHTIIIWRLDVSLSNNKRAIVTLKDEPRKIHTPYVSDLYFSLDDRMIITVHNSTQTINFWDVFSGSLTRTISSRWPLDSSMDLAMVSAPSSVTTHHDSGRSNSVRLWMPPFRHSETPVPG